MTHPARPAILLALAVTAPAVAATEEHVGSWVLSCAGAEPCLMRAGKRFLDKAGITGDLEVQAIGKTLVPVITLRGLSTEILLAASLAGKTEASIQFGGGTPVDLVCAPGIQSFFCSPKDEAADKLAAALPLARSLTVRVSVAVSGLKPLPIQERSLELTGTAEALARLRALGPTPVPFQLPAMAPQTAGGLKDMADKALKAAGYPNGLADLEALLAKYRGK